MRGARFGVFLAVGPDEPGMIWGLCVADEVPGRLSDGEGKGFEGVDFPHDGSVRGEFCATEVSMGANCFVETDSGSSRDSIWSVAVWSG